MPILPERLHPGDTVGLVAPASPPKDSGDMDAAVAALEKLGFSVKLGRHARRRLGFLAGKDRERAADLMAMFTDRKIRGIISARGGYGTARILPLLDYKTIRANPKVLVGFSDITSLHCALLKKANLLSFHGPMAATQIARPDFPEFSRRSWLRMLMGEGVGEGICAGAQMEKCERIRRGRAAGELVGGNLSVLVTTIGTPYQPEFRGRILFLEDFNEAPYRIDRMLTHLLNAGLMQQVAGVAVGECDGCLDPEFAKAGEYRQTLDDVLKERLWPLKVPVVTGLPFGHSICSAMLPVGGRAILDANRGELIVTHTVVK